VGRQPGALGAEGLDDRPGVQVRQGRQEPAPVLRREVREDRPGLPRQPARLLVLHAGEEGEHEALRLPAGLGGQLAELVPLPRISPTRQPGHVS